MEKQPEQVDMDAKLTSPCFTKKRIFRGKVHNLSTLDAIRVIKQKLNPSQLERFGSSCFGKLFHMSTNIKFSGQIVHHLLSRQVNHLNEDEMWFLIGNKLARFSKEEFALITGLNCGQKCPHPHGTTQSTRLVDKYFHGETVIRTKCLKHQFLLCEDDDDVFRFSLVYFLQALLLTREWRASIDRHWMSLVDDLESFNRFPWGDLCYERTLLSMKKIVKEKFEEADSTVKPMSPKYTLRGFPYAFQIWAYEAIPLLGSKFAEKSNKNFIPRILCWESTKAASYDELHENVFGVKNLRVMERLRATELEKEQDYMKAIAKSSFELPENDSHSHDDTERYGDSSKSTSMEFVTTVKKGKKHSKQKDIDGQLTSPCFTKKRIFRGKVHNLSTLEAIRVIKRKLNPSQIKRFESSCFGKLFQMSTNLKFSGQLVHHLLSRQVNHPNKDEMWFLIGNKCARFSKDEFALVTGLNCGQKRPHPHGTPRSTRLVDKYFHGQPVIRTKCLKQLFLSCEDDDDVFRLSLVYFLQALLLTREWRASIDRHWLCLVDDLESFNRFPWGDLCFKRTLLSMKKVVNEKFEEADSTVKPMSPKYTLRGFPYAFQIWAYEAIPLLGSKFAEKSNKNFIPRILCWESTKAASYNELHENVFGVKNLRVMERLRATELEKEQDYMKEITKSSFEPGENVSDCQDDTERYGNSAESMSVEFMKMTTVKKPEKHSKQKGMDAKLSHFFPRHINNLSTLDAIRVIKGKLNSSQLERFESSCFGKIFGTKIKFSGQIVNHLLSRQVDHPNEDEMWFLVGDKRARFSLYEFALITGLNCGPNYPSRTELDGKPQSTRLVDKYFGGRKLIYTRCLKQQFLCCEDEEDSYRLSLVYFLQALLLARNENSSIEKQWLFLVDDLELFDEFPWGKLCYERTLLSLKKRAREYFEENGSINDMAKPKQKHCTLHGFPFAFQIWAYEAIPRLGSYYAEKNTNSIPRILCWERTQSPSFKELRRNVFGVKNLRVLKTLRATELEREQDYMKAMEENDSESIESCLELGEEHDDDDISWGRGKGNRKRKKTNNVPFPFTECSKKQKLVTEANGNLNSNHGIDSMEINQPLEKNNNCNLQTSLQEYLGRDNAFMCNGDKGAQHSNGSRIDLDAFVFGGSQYNKPLPPHILEHLDVIIQHEIDLDFARDFRQSTTLRRG